MKDLAELLDRLEQRVAEAEELPEPARTSVFDLLDGIDAIHRLALHRLADAIPGGDLARVRDADAAVDWLFSAYGVGVDEWPAAEEALETVRPYISSHGGTVDLLDVSDGRVRVRMAGSCSGCTSSAATLRDGIETALREHLPGFVAVEVEEDESAAAHPPPVETFVELGRKSA